jgi:hypothetical protein
MTQKQILPGDAATESGIDFYRRELSRRRYFPGGILRYSLGPIALSIGTLIVVLGSMAPDHGRSLRAIMPFCALVTVWFVLVFVVRSRRQKEFPRELDELKSVLRK